MGNEHLETGRVRKPSVALVVNVHEWLSAFFNRFEFERGPKPEDRVELECGCDVCAIERLQR